MLYRKLQSPDGVYVDKDGILYTLQIVHATNKELEFTPFSSLEECLHAWGLTPL